MINLLKGTIELKTEKFIVVNVGGVGYRVYCLPQIISEVELGQEIKLFCHLYVREDALDLYGFFNQEELEFFESLISISGVGPKLALGVLSLAPVPKIKEAIASGEEDFLIRVSGAGRKLAKKIILELKDKLPKRSEEAKIVIKDELEAIDALIALGYKEREAREAIRKIAPTVKGTENIIKEALKYLAR